MSEIEEALACARRIQDTLALSGFETSAICASTIVLVLSRLRAEREEVGLDATLAELERAKADGHAKAAAMEKLADHLALILPLARGYAAEHQVGSNQQYVDDAANILARHRAGNLDAEIERGEPVIGPEEASKLTEGWT